MRVLDHLLKAIRDAVIFNPRDQIAPASIWTVEEASSLFDIKQQEKRQDAASTIS